MKGTWAVMWVDSLLQEIMREGKQKRGKWNGQDVIWAPPLKFTPSQSMNLLTTWDQAFTSNIQYTSLLLAPPSPNCGGASAKEAPPPYHEFYRTPTWFLILLVLFGMCGKGREASTLRGLTKSSKGWVSEEKR